MDGIKDRGFTQKTVVAWQAPFDDDLYHQRRAVSPPAEPGCINGLARYGGIKKLCFSDFASLHVRM